MIKELCHYEIK